jgi:hypothetical protein
MENLISRQSFGGKANAIKERKKALDKYYENPKRCLYCGKIIVVKDHEKASIVKNKNFCDRKCSTTYLGKLRLNKTKTQNEISSSICCKCKKSFEYSLKTANKRKVCNECKKHSHDYRAIDTKAKGQYFDNKKYWQMARSCVTKHAKKIFNQNNGSKKCFVCGYDKYVEICHKKPVAKFEDSATIMEINNINNLVALCPNHHKELDLGLLKLELAGSFGTHEPDL